MNGTRADYLEAPVCGGSGDANVGGSIGSGQSAPIGALCGQNGHSLSYVLRQMRNTLMTWFRAATCHSTCGCQRDAVPSITLSSLLIYIVLHGDVLCGANY